jgi:uncharacterized protein YndB with AHSA1/START domain
MSFELRIERQFDAQPEAVFDAFIDRSAQGVLHGEGRKGWTVHSVETDIRVGGTSTVVMGPEGQEPDTETRVYTVIERPHRLVLRYAMNVAEWGRVIDTQLTVTYEPRDGGTLLTMVETGFEREEDRDAFMTGWPEFLDTLGTLVETVGPGGIEQPGTDGVMKARHDT